MGSHFLGSPRSQRLLAGKTPVLHVSSLPAKTPSHSVGLIEQELTLLQQWGALPLSSFTIPERACKAGAAASYRKTHWDGLNTLYCFQGRRGLSGLYTERSSDSSHPNARAKHHRNESCQPQLLQVPWSAEVLVVSDTWWCASAYGCVCFAQVRALLDHLPLVRAGKTQQHSRAGSSRAGLQPDLFARSALCCGTCGAGQTDAGQITLERTRLGPVTAAAPWGRAGCPLGAPTECAELQPHPSAGFCSVPLARWPELDKNTTVGLPGTTLLQGC